MCLKKDIIIFLKQNAKNKLLKDMSLNEGCQIYNEASLQYELAKFLEQKGYNVRLEFNIKNFINKKNQNFIKRDIDIVAFKDKNKYAIELKFPRNGQYPEQMYEFIKDIKFMEEVKIEDFNNTYCLTIVDDNKFYDNTLNTKSDKIYNYFRRESNLIEINEGEIRKPTGKMNSFIQLSSSYNSEWRELIKGYKYYLIEI